MRRLLLLLSVLATLTACAAHRIEIQQGNIVSKERLALVKPGMDQQQVRYALGTPLVQDPFHANRWDYFYRLTTDGKEQLTYRVTLHFAQGKLQRVEELGAIPATEREALQIISSKGEKE